MSNKNKDAWEIVQLARHKDRPTAKNLIENLFSNFYELSGDRYFSEDKSFIGGIGYLNDIPVTVIAQEKGTSTKEKIERNFGMPNPEGYRKALRLMKQAEKFGRPIICIIDTPGAYPGIGAEERGQAYAIADNLFNMIDIRVPIISIVLGEGGSGGALAIGVSDEIWMFENAIYSILSPEGFAAILYKDSTLANKAANDMKLTAKDLFDYNIVDFIVPEADEGLHSDIEHSIEIIKNSLPSKLIELQKKEIDLLITQRYKKYRSIGKYIQR